MTYSSSPRGKQVALATLQVLNSRSAARALVHARNEQRAAILVRGGRFMEASERARRQIGETLSRSPFVFRSRTKRSPVRPVPNHATLDTSLDPNLASGL